MVQFVDLAGRIRYANGTYFGPKDEVAQLKAAQAKWDAAVNANKSSGTPPQSSPNHALVESVVAGVAEGKSPEQIAKEQGLTQAQLDAQLAASGFELTKDVNKNRETQSTELINRQTGDVVSGYYENHDAGTRTSRTIDEKGAEVVRTEADDGTITESVTDPDGVETKTTTEPINDGKPIEYEVQPGDNLSDIAADHGVELKDLQESNPDLFEDPRDPDLIYAGERVTIEDGTRTTVEITKDGHTVTIESDGSEADLARKAIFEDGATIEQVAQALGMTPGDVLKMLEEAGLWIDTVDATSGNGDVKSILIADPLTNVLVIESHDYQHDTTNRAVIDNNSSYQVSISDSQTGEIVTAEMSGALGYLHNEASKAADLAAPRIESLRDLIAQAQKRDPDAVPGLRADIKDAELDVKIAGAKADSFVAAMQEAEADRLVADVYDLIERVPPGTDAYSSAQTILRQALDYAGRVTSYADAVDANLALLDAEKNFRAKDAARQQAWSDLQKAYAAFKDEFVWGNVSPETRAQYERDGLLPGSFSSEAEVDKLLWDGFEDTLKQGEPAILQKYEGEAADLFRAWYRSWRAYNQANDASMQARVDYTDSAIAKADSDLAFLRGEAGYLQGLQDQWVQSNPGLGPSTSPFQQPMQTAQSQIQGLSEQRGKLVNDEGYLHDKYLLTLPQHKRDLPRKLNEVEFDYVKSYAQDNSAEIQELQDLLGGPIVGRDDVKVRSMVSTMAAAMGEGGATIDIEKVVTQILRSPQINGDDPDHAGDLTIRPIAMGYFMPGFQTPTGLFEVTNRAGEIHYVDLTGKVFDSKDEFLDDNYQFSENGILVLPKGLDTSKGADGSIEYEAVHALYVSGWDKVAVPFISVGTAVASLAALTGILTPVTAPIALAGGAYLGTNATMAQIDHLDNGGSWGDRESMMNMLSIAATALPMGASGLRNLTLRGTGISDGALAGGLSVTRLTGMRGASVRMAWGMDAAAMGSGTVLIGDTLDQLADYGRGASEMSGLQLADAIVGLGTGIHGTAAGARGLQAGRPFGSSAAHDGSDFSSAASERDGTVVPEQMALESPARSNPSPHENGQVNGPTASRDRREPPGKNPGNTLTSDGQNQGGNVHDPKPTPEVLAAQETYDRADAAWRRAEAAERDIRRRLKNVQDVKTLSDLTNNIEDASANTKHAAKTRSLAAEELNTANNTAFENRVREVLGWVVPEMQGETRFLNGRPITRDPQQPHAQPDGYTELRLGHVADFYALEVKNLHKRDASHLKRVIDQINKRHQHLIADQRHVQHVVVLPAKIAKNPATQLQIAQRLSARTDGKVNVEDVFFLADHGNSVILESAVPKRQSDDSLQFEQVSEELLPPENTVEAAPASKGAPNQPKNLSAAFHLEGAVQPLDPNMPVIPGVLRSAEDRGQQVSNSTDAATEKALRDKLIFPPDGLTMRTDPHTLDPGQMRWSKGEKVEPRTREQLEALPLSEIEALTRPQIKKIPGIELGLVSPGQFRKFTPEQFTWMSEQWNALAAQQLVAFRKTHARQMTPDQKATVELVLTSARARELQDAADVFNPMGGSSYVLWNSLPPDWVATAAGVAFAWRGVVFSAQSLFPKATAPHTKLGRLLNGANGISFIATSPGSAAPLIDSGINPGVNGTFTLGNMIFGTKSTLDSLGARSSLGFASDYIGNVAYLGGSALYAVQNLDSTLAWTAGTIFSVGSAEFLASAIRKNNKYGRDVPRTEEDIAAAAKSDRKWAAWDRIALGGTFGLGMGLFAYDSLDDLWSSDETSEPTDTSAPADVSQDQEREEPAHGPPQLIVNSDDGLNLRASPNESSNIVAILQPDTFIQQTGEPVTTGARSWVPVEGYATDGNRHEGWVLDEYVQPHPGGARTSRGRINPKLEQNGFEWIEVTANQTLGGIARDYQRDTTETVVLNFDHIADPARLFEGDRIYLPLG